MLSTATVYGAWPNNPVPITEDAPLRPVPDFAYAVGHAEVEQLVVDWAEDDPERTVAVLRPVTGLAEDGSSWLARALAGGAGVLAPEEDPPAQFVHLDDLAAAVDLVRRKRLDGTYNVSPDGWIAGPRLRALAGSKPRVRPPAWVIHWVGNMRWRFQRGPIPPGLLPYTTYAWLVANDRLKAEGWQPKVTNEQAYVAGTENRWWQLLSPKRRQELALGLAGVVVGGRAGDRRAPHPARRAGRPCRRGTRHASSADGRRRRDASSGSEACTGSSGFRSCGAHACRCNYIGGQRAVGPGPLPGRGGRSVGGAARRTASTCDGLAAADQREVDGVADLALADEEDQRVHVVHGHAVDRHDDVALEHAGLGGGALRVHADHVGALHRRRSAAWRRR